MKGKARKELLPRWWHIVLILNFLRSFNSELESIKIWELDVCLFVVVSGVYV